MKKINLILITVLCALGITSCSDEEGVKIGTNPKPPVLDQLLPENYVITESTIMTNNVGYWRWKPADFGANTAVKYTVEADTVDGNFSKPITITDSFNDYAMITAGMLNTAGIRVSPDESKIVSLDVRIKANVYKKDNDTAAVAPIYSNIQTITFTTYVPKATLKAPLFIVGGVFSATAEDAFWWKNDPTQIGLGLQPLFSESNDPKDGTYSYTGYFYAAGFKLIVTPSVWNTGYGSNGEGKLKIDGGDIVLSTSGWYKLEVDINALTYKFTSIAAPAATSPYSKIGVLGSATSTGWNSQTDLEQLPFNKHLWKTKDGGIELKAEELKIRANNAWDVSWGQEDGFPFGKGNGSGDPNVKIPTAGNYCIMFNDLTNEFTFINLK